MTDSFQQHHQHHQQPQHQPQQFSIQPQQEDKKCLTCEATSTPEWRTGPEGKGSLCNGFIFLFVFFHKVHNINLIFLFFFF